MAVKPIPDNMHTVTPYLVVKGVPQLIDFMKQVFEGKEIERMAREKGLATVTEAMMDEVKGKFSQYMGMGS